MEHDQRLPSIKKLLLAGHIQPPNKPSEKKSEKLCTSDSNLLALVLSCLL